VSECVVAGVQRSSRHWYRQPNNKETKHHIHSKHKRETEKNCPGWQNDLHAGLVRLLRPPARKRSKPYSYLQPRSPHESNSLCVFYFTNSVDLLPL